MGIMDIVEKYPLPILGGAGVLALILFSGRGGSSDGGAQVSLASQEIATGGNVAIAEINSRSRIAANTNAASVFMAGIDAMTDRLAINTQGQIDALVASNQYSVQKKQISAMQDMNADDNRTSQNIAFKTLATELTALQEKNRFNQTIETMRTKFASDNLKPLIDFQTNMAIINSNTTENLAEISANSNEMLARISGQDAIQLARLQTSAERRDSKTNQITGIIEAGAGILGKFF